MQRFLSYTLLGTSLLFMLGACDTTDLQEQEAVLRTNLNAPTLLQPRIEQTLPASIAFEWTPVTGATRYELALYAESAATTKQPPPTSTAAPFYHVTLAAGVYTWRVRALDARGRAGYWSTHRRLTVMPR